ncbi:uncharacterized protein LOC121856265 [Homarus americanus]|uniref:Uncharacterized protein n=1 Tax=Homarus americanus TaxID=6706 RepID=A0A8J5J827_HOMAM|nr:uncharacterized protein LOC121856265 [Homarus americanus]KAG7154482.1 hypothetical protein Hamer_G018233 [Homarus americanus]
MVRFNSTDLKNPIGASASGAALALDLVGFLVFTSSFITIGRKKRNTHDYTDNQESFLQQMLFTVLTDLDDSGCAALALCHASSLPPEQRNPDHTAIIATLSPHPGSPVSWTDFHTPDAKYQYAAFIGLWAGLTANQNQCSHVFPSCPLPPAEITKILANKQVPCGNGSKTHNIIDQ